MGISASEFASHVIRPTLQELNCYSESFERLLLATASVETDIGTHIHDEYPGLGIYRITPEQHQAVWDSYLAFETELASQVRGYASQHHFLEHPHDELATNLSYATAIAIAIYLNDLGTAPKNGDDSILIESWDRQFGAANPLNRDNFIYALEKTSTAIH